jgi:hypothetical protein
MRIVTRDRPKSAPTLSAAPVPTKDRSPHTLIPRAGARQQPKQPDAVADDLGREPIPSVAGASGCRHLTRLLTPVRQRKRESPPAKLTVPPKVTV